MENRNFWDESEDGIVRKEKNVGVKGNGWRKETGMAYGGQQLGGKVRGNNANH